MNKIILGGVAAVTVAGGIALAAPASAYPNAEKDTEFIACTSNNGIYNPNGPNVGAAFGRQIASDIELGLRNALEERDYVYRIGSATVTITTANILVNCATGVYLGYGPAVHPDGTVV